jgi:glutamate-ammonia-ligase adenylyltransferase
MPAVRRAIIGQGWQPSYAEEIRRMRARLEETATRRNLKRGPGGTVDIEFAVQALQMKHAADAPGVLQPGTLDAIEALHQAGVLSPDDRDYLSRSYRFLRSIEARLRLMNTAARHDLPSDEKELGKLAYLLNYPSVESLLQECDRFTQENRHRCQRLFDQAAR